MKTTEHLNGSAIAGKAGEVRKGASANGDTGSNAHEEEGSQAEEGDFTAEAVARLLKSDLTDAAEPEPDEIETASGAGEGQTSGKDGKKKGKEKEKARKPGAEGGAEGEEGDGDRKAAEGRRTPEAGAPAEALKEAEGWRTAIAELESKLADADSDEEKASVTAEIAAAKEDLAAWEKLASGEAGAAGAEVPEALATAISEWEENGGGELPPALQGLVEKRLNKLTSQRESEKSAREAAEARVTALEAELENAKLQTSNATGSAGATGLMDPKRIAALERSGTQFVEDVEGVLDGTATEEELARVAQWLGSERLDAGALTVEQQRKLKQGRREVSKVLAGLPAERTRVEQFRAAEAQANMKAKAWFPFLEDKASPEYQDAQQVLAMMPGLREATPAWRVALGAYVVGLKELKRMHPEAFGGLPGGGNGAGAPGKVTIPRKAPSKSPAGGAAAPRGARARSSEAEEGAARSEFERRPSAESVTRLLKIGMRS